VIVSFTHDCEMPALLPGIAPTGRKVTLPHVVVVGFDHGKIAYEHIYWDQASRSFRSVCWIRRSCR
jgi:carboxymethylenebutenolidase